MTSDRIKEIAGDIVGVSLTSVKRPVVRYGEADMDRKLVEMMVAAIRERFVEPPLYLERPAHFPDSDDELRRVWLSKAARDQGIRGDVRDWIAINRRACDQCAVSLKNAIAAIAIAQKILDRNPEDVEIAEWRGTISTHVRMKFGVRMYDVPKGNTEAWCFVKLAEMSPVPEWLRESKPSGVVGNSSMLQSMINNANTERKADDDDAGNGTRDNEDE